MTTHYEVIIDGGIGTAVVCSVPCCGDPEGTRAIVYEVYGQDRSYSPGVSLISENGKDWGGFSKFDIVNTLRHIGEVDLEYKFKSSVDLAVDARNGLFKNAIAQVKLLSTDVKPVD